MPNIFEAVTNTIKTFTDNEPKSPMHVGEVMDCWIYLTSLQASITFEESGLNTTTDDELKRTLQDGIKLCESQVSKLKEFMQNEGIPLSDVSASKPKSDPDAVPLGVKSTDDELANALSIKFATANIMCATAEANAVRNDVGMMWIGFQNEMLTFGSTLKVMMRKRGWIKIPPYYYPPGLPKQ